MNIFGIDENLSDLDGAKEAISRLREFLFDTMGLKEKLSDLGIDDKHFSEMVKKACPQGVLDGFVKLSPRDVEAILHKSL